MNAASGAVAGETTHQEYRRLFRECGYEGDGIIETVWNKCDAKAQQYMLEQMRAGALLVADWNRYAPRWGVW